MRRFRGFVHVMVAAVILAFAVSFVAPPSMAQSGSALDRIQSDGKLRVGWATWWPYAYKDPENKNELSGVAIDVFELMAKELKTEVVWVEDSWATLIAGLQANKFDVTLPMGRTLERAKAATYASPFLQFGSGIVIRKEDAAKYKSWQDLDKDGLKVAVALGSTGDTFASRKFANADVVRLRSEPELLMSLVTKKVNAWHSTYGAFQKILPKHPNLMIMPATTLAIVPTGFVVRQGDWHWVQWLDFFIEDINQTGELIRILDKHGLGEPYVYGSMKDQASAIPTKKRN
jgi:ABC-type amino acid transport substrate-binding protein